MKNENSTYVVMRALHRYLGFFLAGIMTVYAISGMVLVFRDTDFLKQEKQVEKEIKKQAEAKELGDLLKLRRIKIQKEEGDKIYFDEGGVYDKQTGRATFTVKELPYVLNQMTHLHKAKSADPLFFFSIFFGLSLFFFVISSFWMFRPETPVFKKGLYLTLGGIVLTLVLLYAS